MTFVHSGIALAAAAVALAPLVLHLLSRRGYRSEPWAAMRFVIAAERRVRRRLRLEQWLLLALRTLVLLFAGLGLARPIAVTSSGALLSGGRRCDIAVVLDDSLSMHARRSDGLTAFDAGRRAARELISQAHPQDGFTLIRAGAPAEALLETPTRDRQVLERLIANSDCSTRMTDLAGAMRLAARTLSGKESLGAGRVCYVISDFARGTSAASAEAQGASPSPAEATSFDRVILVDVGPKDRGNLAVTSLEPISEIVGIGVPAEFRVTIANEREEAVEAARLEVTVDGVVAAEVVLGPIEPREAEAGRFSLVFTRAGAHRVRARIRIPAEDAFQEDNERYLAVEVAARLNLLCIQDDPFDPQDADELLYFKTALKSGFASGEEQGFSIRTEASARLDDLLLDGCDLVALSDVRRLSEVQWRRLERFVNGGGGLIVFLGPGASACDFPYSGAAESENRSRASASDPAPTDALPDIESASTAPHTLSPPFELDHIVRIDEADALPTLVAADARHSALWDFSGDASGGLGRATVRGYWKIDTNAGRNLRTLIRLSTGDPIIVTSDAGRGRVAWCLTSADMTWTTLPAKPDYVPLMLNLASHLTQGRRARLNILSGRPLIHQYPVTAARSSAMVTDPLGRVRRFELLSDGEGAWLAADGLHEAGFYAIEIPGLRTDAAVNYDTEDRDLSQWNAAELERRFGHDAEMIRGSQSPGQAHEQDAGQTASLVLPRLRQAPTEFSTLLLICVLAFMAGEMAVGAWGVLRR